MLRKLLLPSLLLLSVTAAARQWLPDSLSGYEYTRVERLDGQPCTVIRRTTPCASGRAVLYIHGYNDYFFNAEMGNTFVDSLYNFYAVDLHGYGRSIVPGRRPYQARHISDYYADIDSALNIMGEYGTEHVVLMGHSTGGLIAACFMTFSGHPGDEENTPFCARPHVDALILNSPFLEFNFKGFKRSILLPLMSTLGGPFPGIAIPQGNAIDAYAQSCSADFHGEWRYNYAWKTARPRPITTGWIRMIMNAQRSLRDNPERILVPTLLMHSARSVYGNKWTPEFQRADAVLDVDHIARYGSTLGPSLTEMTVEGGMHDLFLSAEAVRIPLYRAVFAWLNRNFVFTPACP